MNCNCPNTYNTCTQHTCNCHSHCPPRNTCEFVDPDNGQISGEFITPDYMTLIQNSQVIGTLPIPLSTNTNSNNITIANLKLNTTTPDLVYVTDSNLEGNFRYDPLDSTSINDNRNIIVTVDGKRYKRLVALGKKDEFFNNILPNTNSVTLQELPYQLENLVVIRNGINTKEYSIVGKVITFIVPFGNSSGGIYSEVLNCTYTY